jgi:hypothetical protein
VLAIVLLVLFVSLSVVAAVFVLMFVSVASEKPDLVVTRPGEASAGEPECRAQEVLARISQKKTDPGDDASPTFGELIDQGYFGEVLGSPR